MQPEPITSTGHRFLRAYAAIAMVIVIGLLTVAVAVRNRNTVTGAEAQIWRPAQAAVRDLTTVLLDQENGAVGFVATGEEQFRARYLDGRRQAGEGLSELGHLLDDQQDLVDLVADVEARLTQWQAQVEPAMDRAASRDSTTLLEDTAVVGAERFDQVRTSHDDLRAAIDEQAGEISDRRNQTFVMVVVTALAAFGMLTLVSVAFLRRSRRWVIDLRTTEARLRYTIATIQASLLPSIPPPLENAEVAGAYRSASSDTDLGGDFYDVRAGAAGTVTVSIGDVSGHDIDAAAVTSMVRHAINAAAQHLEDPGEVLRWANDTIRREVTDGRFVTAALGRLVPSPDQRGAALLLGLAGHPRPILLPADGSAARELGEGGTLLGVTSEPKIVTTTTELRAGDQVLFFTDGLCENSNPRLSNEALMAMVSEARRGSAADTTKALLAAYEQLDLRSECDDLALLVLQVRPVRADVISLASQTV